MSTTCYYLCVSVFLFIGTWASDAQSTSKRVGYKDFALYHGTILLLSNEGQLKLITAIKADSAVVLPTDRPIAAVGFDRMGNIVAGDTNHVLSRFDQRQRSWHRLTTYSGTLTGIVVNSLNQCLLITNKGVVDPNSHTTYYPDSSFSKNEQVRHRYGWFQPPVSFLDHRDKLWVGFDYGEWGGNVFCFDTRQRTFSELKIDSVRMNSNRVSGFFEDQQAVYMSGGVSYMFLTHGSMIRFADGVGRPLLAPKNRETPVETNFTDASTGKNQTSTGFIFAENQQIGPFAYNSVDSCLYFYSQNGIYKGNQKADLSDIAHWENVLKMKPKLSWTGGRSNAAGPVMNVLKMQFMADGTLLFLTEHEGLGIYSHNRLRFIK